MVYVLLSVLLMALDQGGHFIPRARAALAVMLEPIYELVEMPAEALRGLATFGRSWESLREENRRQARQLLEQAAAVQRLESLRLENQRLRDLLDATQGRDFEFRFAELMTVSLDPYAHRVVIDRGGKDGVFPGQAVIDGQGVVGQVESVQLSHATVLLISDPDHALPVQILRTGQRTIALGTGDPSRLELTSLPLQADIRAGDTVVTSGLGERFPRGLPVAVIERVDRETGGAFARVDARPLAALDRGREVLLVQPGGGATADSDGAGLGSATDSSGADADAEEPVNESAVEPAEFPP
jgi:rod shape-determining protein MreC